MTESLQNILLDKYIINTNKYKERKKYLCFIFYILCFMFYVLCFMFYVLCFIFYIRDFK
jgi:hypothetical protein